MGILRMIKTQERPEKVRCRWCSHHPLYQAYHDEEWGNPDKSEQALFELFILETQHAGLSWWTVLSKREGYRRALMGFDPQKISRMGSADVARLLKDDAIIRHQLKITAMIHNAQTYLQFVQEVGTFQAYFWQKVGGTPIINHYLQGESAPVTTPLSDSIAKELKKFGFKFFGSRTAYAFLQAAGFIDDHLSECYLSREKRT